MITVHLPLDLSAAFKSDSVIQMKAETLGDLVLSLEERHPGMASWLTESTGQFRQHLSVFLGGQRLKEAGAGTRVPDNTEVWILRAVSGG